MKKNLSNLILKEIHSQYPTQEQFSSFSRDIYMKRPSGFNVPNHSINHWDHFVDQLDQKYGHLKLKVDTNLSGKHWEQCPKTLALVSLMIELALQEFIDRPQEILLSIEKSTNDLYIKVNFGNFDQSDLHLTSTKTKSIIHRFNQKLSKVNNYSLTVNHFFSGPQLDEDSLFTLQITFKLGKIFQASHSTKTSPRPTHRTQSLEA